MAKYMDSGGLSHLMSKVKAWAAATFAPLSHTHDYTKTRVKGNAESSYRTGDVNLTPANIGALGASDNAVSATKLKTARAINVGNKATGTATNFDGSANITVPVNSFLTDGLVEPSIVKSGTKTSLPLVDTLKGNKLALLPADQIIIEKTTDGGTTWVDAGISDTAKMNLFVGNTTGTSIPMPLLNGNVDTKCGIRITFTPMKYNVPEGTAETGKYAYWNSTYVKSTERYGSLQAFYIWLSSGAHGFSCKCERAPGNNPDSWYTVFDRDSQGNYLTGWSGGNYIAFGDTIFGGGTTQITQPWNWRLTFFLRGTGANGVFNQNYLTQGTSINRISGYGANLWNVPNNLAGIGHLYTWDIDKTAIFPGWIIPDANNKHNLGTNSVKWANVYATSLTGDVTGGIRPATYRPTSANTTGYGCYLRYFLATSSMTTGKPDGDGHVLDMEWDNNGKWHGQLAVPADSSKNVQWRTEAGGTWTAWRKLFDDSDVIPAANGGTGEASLNASANALINALTTGSSDPKDSDYYVSQYANGGTATTTFHRRPMSALWNYVKSKITSTLLSSATNSSSESLAATPKAVKAAYDLASGASATAGQALSAATGAYAFKVTYSVSGSSVVCAAHVYSSGAEVTTSHAESCFSWSMSLDGGTSWTALGTGRTKTVSAITAFGGNVKCDFTPAS